MTYKISVSTLREFKRHLLYVKRELRELDHSKMSVEDVAVILDILNDNEDMLNMIDENYVAVKHED